MAQKDSRALRLFNETKLEELEYYKEKYRKTLKEWKRFMEGSSDIDRSVVPVEVLEAWIRCRELGIDPYALPRKKILKGRELDALLIRNREFIDVSRPFLSNLYQFLKGSGFNVALFDGDGYLLEIMGDHDIADEMRNTGGVIGALWNEPSAGHNVVGSIVMMKKPVQLFGSQNYIKLYHEFK